MTPPPGGETLQDEVENVRITGSTIYGIAFGASRDGTVQNIVSHGGPPDPRLAQLGFPFGILLDRSAAGDRIEGNSVSEHGKAIVVSNPSSRAPDEANLIRENVTSHNGGGIDLTFTHNSQLERNTSIEDKVGLSLSGSNNRIERNSFTKNLFAIALNGSRRNRVVGNTASESSSQAILLSDAHGNEIARNSLSRSGEGISVLYDSTGNNISTNSILGNGTGILVAIASTDNLIKGNLANENTDDGIRIAYPHNTLARNTTNNNGDLGIEAVAGVIDGGGNRAFGNGNPLQCLNVTCK